VRVIDDPAMGRRSTTRVARAPPGSVVVTPPPPVAHPVVVAVATASAPPVAGLRWVRHPHHHELDYQLDADGHRVGANPPRR
jgi:hypothetical protein